MTEKLIILPSMSDGMQIELIDMYIDSTNGSLEDILAFFEKDLELAVSGETLEEHGASKVMLVLNAGFLHFAKLLITSCEYKTELFECLIANVCVLNQLALDSKGYRNYLSPTAIELIQIWRNSLIELRKTYK